MEIIPLRLTLGFEGYWSIDILHIQREWWYGSLFELTWSERHGFQLALFYHDII